MIWISICIIIGLIVWARAAIDCSSVFIGFSLAFCWSLIALFITAGIVTVFPTEIRTDIEPRVEQIYAIEDNNYIFKSTMDNTPQYSYMTTDEFGFTIYTVDNASFVIIPKDEKEVTPHVYIYEETFTSPFLAKLFAGTTVDHKYVFYIPEGTICTEYNIDME
ncbi:MAG: hypothetical protein IKB70_08160 [Bacilli bacterium]|nr:hypothetical protein [Bacilli bacterium]